MRRFLPIAFTACFVFVGALRASGQAVLLLEEPFAKFGHFNPTGHAAIYLPGVCAETPVVLRHCKAGELGAVISRYHRIDGYDWIAVPLVSYLYAVDDVAEIPKAANRSLEAELRDTYRRQHLEVVAPDGPKGATPKGEWIQLVGSSYDRKIYGFEIPATAEQDERLIEDFNARRNRGHFNLLFHNCADFSRSVIDTYYAPHAMHRNWIADVGITTPKQLVRSLERTSRERGTPLHVFVIPQVPGSIPRSIRVDGLLEAFLKRKYVLPVAVLHPFVAGSLALAYLGDGRFSLPKDPVALDVAALSRNAMDQAAMDQAAIERSLIPGFLPAESALSLVVTQPAASAAQEQASATSERQQETERATPVNMHTGN